MNDKDFAAEIVERLNKLLESHPEVRKDISALFCKYVSASTETVLHPTLQVSVGGGGMLGVLGLLNGVTGTVKYDETKRGYGLITSVTGDDGLIQHFEVTA